MRNAGLARDYLVRAQKRLKAVETLLREESYADVVRESQEVVELALKALLRTCQIEVPQIHDVSGVLEENREALPKAIRKDLPQLARASRRLRRDLELAFYGSEDLTPSEFYKKRDADEALAMARMVVDKVSRAVVP